MDINYSKVCYGCFCEKTDPAHPLCPVCGFDASAETLYPLALPPGSILNGRYLVGKPLGQGGFGITYLVFDMTLQVKVAVKEFLPAGMISRGTDRSTVVLLTRRNDEEFSSNKEKFLDEARILARLADALGIVKVQNYFTENNTAYFTMEFIDGISLKDLVAQQGGRLPWQLAHGYLLPIASALTQVHTENLLHRDISPDNIFITKKGVSKLLDFGAARSSAGDSHSMSIILKHGFAPEEQYRAHGKQGPWTDVYALAATYYYCLTGLLVPDSIDRLHADTLVAPSQLGVSLPAVAEAALLKALAVNAANRFADMQAFMDAVTGRKPVAMPPVASVASAIPPVVKPSSKRIPLLIGGGVAAVALIAVAITLVILNPFSAGQPSAGSDQGQEQANETGTGGTGTGNPGSGSGSDGSGGSGTSGTETPGTNSGSTNPPVEENDNYYYSTQAPVAVLPLEGWKIDDNAGSLMFTSTVDLSILSFFQIQDANPAVVIAEKDSMIQTAVESFRANSYTFLSEEKLSIADRDFYLINFNMELNDGIYAVEYYVTADNARGSIISMFLKMPGATDKGYADMMTMLKSLRVL